MSKKTFIVPKNAKDGTIWAFFIIQLGAKNQNTQREDPLATFKK